MTLNDLIREIGLRCSLTEERARALLSDLRICGVQDGPRLQDAFDEWRREWDKTRAPLAGEFKKFYTKVERDQRIEDRDTQKPNPEVWAWKAVREMPEGKAAVNAGFGYDAWLWYRDNPGKVLPPGYVDEMSAAAERTAATLAAGKPENAMLRAALMKTFDAMNKRHLWFATECHQRADGGRGW